MPALRPCVGAPVDRLLMNNNRTGELETLLASVEGNAMAMVTLARMMHAPEVRELAVELCARAMKLAPGDGEVRTVAAEVLSAGIPKWHVDIVRDHGRNDAYEAALQRAVSPGCKVLEIGTGTGLLAMMAIRAGAAQVITCEFEPSVAMAAREVIARNGFADRIRVITRHSTALEVERDLNGPADVLVSEILANDLLGEGTLAPLEHAYRHLLKPGALIVPARGRVRVALADDDDWQHARMGEVSGFDLSAFNQVAAPYREIHVGASRLTLRSDPVDLFTFDFASGGPFPETKADVKLTSSGRHVNGIAQWIALDMDATATYENRPEPGADSSWWAVFHPFSQPVELKPGQQVSVHARHDRGALRVWAEGLG
jgi:Ribosomal protein L11 methyltransferase (PrmA)